jgi:hypothetical protein
MRLMPRERLLRDAVLVAECGARKINAEASQRQKSQALP